MEEYRDYDLTYSPDGNWIVGTNDGRSKQASSRLIGTTRLVSADGGLVWDVRPEPDDLKDSYKLLERATILAMSRSSS
ncbi:MAG: hypothetical protein AB1894_18010 [Chloroflexota bacterium]